MEKGKESRAFVLSSLNRIFRGEGDPPAGGGDPPAAAPDWRAEFSDDLKTNEVIKDLDTPVKMAEAYVDLHGKRHIVPEKVEDYKLDLSDEQVTNLGGNDTLSGMVKSFHEAGFSEAQVKFVVDKVFVGKKHTAEARQAANKVKYDEGMEALKKIHGDKTDEVVKNAMNFVQRTGDKDLWDYLEQSKLGNDPRFIAWASKLSKGLSEEIFATGDPPAGGDEMERTDGGTPMLDFSKSMGDK